MNATFKRLFVRKELDIPHAETAIDSQRDLLTFVISKGSPSADINAFKKRLNTTTFHRNPALANFEQVQFYLEIEYYLIYKDPAFIGTEESLRTLIRKQFPNLSENDAFLPLFEVGKSMEISLSRNFIAFLLLALKEEQPMEKLAARWINLLHTALTRERYDGLVAEINALRKLRESTLDVYNNFVETFGKPHIDSFFGDCHTQFLSFYRDHKGLRCLEDLMPFEEDSGKSEFLEQVEQIADDHSIVPPFTDIEISKSSILENILDGFLTIDGNGQILECNTLAASILGGSTSEVEGESFCAFMPDKFAEELNKDLKKGNITIPNQIVGSRQEIILTSPENKEVEYEISITNNYTEAVDTYSVFLKNISHKADTLKAIEEAKAIAERNANAKASFLSNMSHEIRTPLNVILGLSEIINKSDLADPVLLKKNLEGIDFSAKNLLSIVNDILDFSKIEAGKLSIQAIDFNLRKIVSSLCDGFEMKAREKGIVLKSSIAPNVPDLVIGDQYRLNQILNNLISNAVKFTNKGEVAIEVNVFQKDVGRFTLEFSVRDTGVGIEEGKLDKVFDSFYQLQNKENLKATGTGLGLAITKQLIELQNGTLTVQSKENEGSEFIFTLPFQESKLKKIADSVKRFAGKDEKLEGLKVLVAEDNKMNQFYIKQLLENLLVEVDIVENGKEAVEAFEQSQFDYDLILMDMHMPVMDGIEAISLIRKTNKNILKKVPIVACSADVFPEARKNAIKAGIDFYLTKPLNEDAVKEVLFWLISDIDFQPKLPSDGELMESQLPSKQSSHIDISRLLDTFDGDEAFIISLLEIFIAVTPEDYNSMKNCMHREYYARASSLAHKMKSSFMNLGMTVHGHHLQQIESHLLRKEGIPEAKKHLSAFSSLYTKALLETNILLIELKQK